MLITLAATITLTIVTALLAIALIISGRTFAALFCIIASIISLGAISIYLLNTIDVKPEEAPCLISSPAC